MSYVGSSTKNRQTIPSLLTTPGKSNEANDNASTPMGLLTEFLFSIMKKDYEKALNYCTQILNYEPHNSTVREFYPLILEKLEMKELQSSGSSESYSSDSSKSSDESVSDNEIMNIKDSSKTYKSFKDDSIDCLGPTLMKTKRGQSKAEDIKKNISKPLKERN